jgi:hypothetical protein
MKAKSIIIVQTPVHFKAFTQVTCLMDDDELEQAKKERPDLIFRKAQELPVQEPIPEPAHGFQTLDCEPVELKELTEDQGITVKGMTLPANLDYLIQKVIGKE